MSTPVSIAAILIASIVLIQAVKFFIDSSSRIARHIGISAYTISFLIIAVATSLPETVVGITSALEGNPILSFGNAIGSNIALLTLVIALPVLFTTEKGISTRTILHSRDAYYSTFFAFLPIALIVDGELTSTDGIILLAAYVFYFILVWRRSSPIEHLLEKFEGVNIWKESVLFIFSLLLLLGASEVIVKSAQALSIQLNWGLTFVGLTITAIGTSLPEIVFTLGASKRRFQQEVLGDVVGSVVANSTIVLGVTSIIHPIKIKSGEMSFSSLLMLVFIMLIFLRFTRTKEKIDKFEAGVLLIMYFMFVGIEYYLQATGFKLTF
jgi:cation:H+ antiporter